MEEFQRRDWFAVTQCDPYLAFAELALRERAQVARAAWGLHRMEGLALLVLEPDRWDAEVLDDLHLSVRHWLSDTISVWFAEGSAIRPADRPGAKPPFTATSHSEDAQRVVDAGRESTTSSSAISADHGDEPLTPPPSTSARTSDSHRLSREEIDMLLRESEAGLFESGRHRGEQP
jgi:hypothetical protein